MRKDKSLSNLVGRDAGGVDILSYRDFLKLFNGEVLNMTKNKFIIKKDGIYIEAKAIRVKIGQNGLLKIKKEVENIIKNINHPLYKLAKQIEAISFTALMIRSPACLSLTNNEKKDVRTYNSQPLGRIGSGKILMVKNKSFKGSIREYHSLSLKLTGRLDIKSNVVYPLASHASSFLILRAAKGVGPPRE